MQSMVETLEMERKELLDKVKKLERCERQERDRFLRERAAKEAVLQASIQGGVAKIKKSNTNETIP